VSDWVDVAPESAFPPGDARLVEVGDTRIAVVNVGGEYFAIEDVCTHDGSPMLGSGLDPADLVHGDRIICPRHGAQFCLRTGEALTPPAWEPVARFPVRVKAGMVQVRDDRDD
jgi:3-phenylpropionate/trans-cinnamate dioxygenase ferredoxin subunit